MQKADSVSKLSGELEKTAAESPDSVQCMMLSW